MVYISPMAIGPESLLERARQIFDHVTTNSLAARPGGVLTEAIANDLRTAAIASHRHRASRAPVSERA